MDIIIFCDENGMTDDSSSKDFPFNREFRLIEVSTIDEDEINHIIDRSINNKFKLTKVHVLYDEEYNKLKHDAKQWNEFKEWNNAKVLYEMKKERFEKL